MAFEAKNEDIVRAFSEYCTLVALKKAKKPLTNLSWIMLFLSVKECWN